MDRLPLPEFNVQISTHVDAFTSAQEGLQTVTELLHPGRSIWPSDFDHAIKCLMRVGEHSRNFHAFIEQSGHLPLVVVPLRLPLLLALTEVELRIAKLKRMLATLHEVLWKVRHQPTEQKLAIQCELYELQLNCKEVLDQMIHLKKNLQLESDRSKFEKRHLSLVN